MNCKKFTLRLFDRDEEMLEFARYLNEASHSSEALRKCLIFFRDAHYKEFSEFRALRASDRDTESQSTSSLRA